MSLKGLMNAAASWLPRRRSPLHLVADFSHLKPGGASGGVKPFLFELMKWLGRQNDVPLRITYLTRSASHHELRPLLRDEDRLICIREDPDRPLIIEISRTSESVAYQPDIDLLLQVGADILYCPFGSVEMHCPGIPALAFVVDLLHRDYPFSLSQEAIDARERVLQATVRTADAIQCNSRFVIDRMNFHYQFPRERMFYVYNAVQHRLANALPSQKADTNLPQREFFFYPANAWTHKNHPTLLVAYRHYLDRAGVDAWPLVLTGYPDSQMDELVRYAHALGLGDRVRFLGYLGEHEFAAVWCRAGALLFPSLHEGFGIPPIEAMAMGIPVISSGEASLAEILGEAALVLDPRQPGRWADAMFALAADKAQREELIRRGREHAKRFNLDHEAPKLLRAIAEARNTPPRSRHRGIDEDRWTGRKAIISLPGSAANRTLSIECLAIPVARSVRVFNRARLAGSYNLPAQEAHTIQVRLDPNDRNMVVEVLDATNLNPLDQRMHGILIRRVTVTRPGEEAVVLFPSS